ncbi:hypothetical protein ALP64_203832 [Pseudomonas syringae pv. actinidiae]|nr:hypothetical protein ALP64_203832 [Pseudomonas syringae pv. actinidiae]
MNFTYPHTHNLGWAREGSILTKEITRTYSIVFPK